MSRYMVSWKANPSAWPTDPKQALTVIEGAIAGGDQLIMKAAVHYSPLTISLPRVYS